MTYPFPNFNGYTVEVWEWIRNLIPYFIIDVITYPYWGTSYTMLVKGATGVRFDISRKVSKSPDLCLELYF